MINDYDSLQSAISDWLKRADLTSAIPTFIQLAEARINRTLFVRERQAQVDAATVQGAAPMPEDLDRIQSVQVARGGYYEPVSAIPPSEAAIYNGAPIAYTVVNGEIRFVGTQDTDYRLTYWSRIPPLSGSNTSNWLLDKQPGIYLFGALIEASPYMQNDERALIWGRQFQDILDDMMRSDDYARYGIAPAATVSGHAP